MNIAPLTAERLSQIEDAGLNASAPPQQLWMDGWLVRLSPGKAKRARCIHAMAAGRLPLAVQHIVVGRAQAMGDEPVCGDGALLVDDRFARQESYLAHGFSVPGPVRT